MISSYITGDTKYGKRDTEYGRGYKMWHPLAIFCIPTHFVGDTLSVATQAPDITELLLSISFAFKEMNLTNCTESQRVKL